MSYIERERQFSESRPVMAVHAGLQNISHLNAEGYFRHAGWDIHRSAEVELALALGYKQLVFVSLCLCLIDHGEFCFKKPCAVSGNGFLIKNYTYISN